MSLCSNLNITFTGLEFHLYWTKSNYLSSMQDKISSIESFEKKKNSNLRIILTVQCFYCWLTLRASLFCWKIVRFKRDFVRALIIDFLHTPQTHYMFCLSVTLNLLHIHHQVFVPCWPFPVPISVLGC